MENDNNSISENYSSSNLNHNKEILKNQELRTMEIISLEK